MIKKKTLFYSPCIFFFKYPPSLGEGLVLPSYHCVVKTLGYKIQLCTHT